MSGIGYIPPKEKWERMKNPTCAADYGLSIDATELSTFEEGRMILKCVREHADRLRSFNDGVKAMGKTAAKSIADQFFKELGT